MALGALLVTAQEGTAETAVLLKGPTPVRGIPYLDVNVLPCQTAVYGHGGVSVGVVYTEAEVVTPDSWRWESCGTVRYLRVPEVNRPAPAYLFGGGFLDDAAPPERGAVIYYREGEWAVFLEFPPDYPDPCAFLTVFLKRLRYFLGVTERGLKAPLPAHLEL